MGNAVTAASCVQYHKSTDRDALIMNKKAISRIATVAAAGALLAGCAAPQNPDPRDPWEGFNRGIYKFNDTVDRAVFAGRGAGVHLRHAGAGAQLCAQHLQQRRRPLVGHQQLPAGPRPRLRQHARPLPVQHHHGRGRLLRRRPRPAARAGSRTTSGTTPASGASARACTLVLPFFGSSSVRDGAGSIGDYAGDAPTATWGVDAIDNVPLHEFAAGPAHRRPRAPACWTPPTVDRVALDPYSFVRDATAAAPCRHGAGPEGG